MSRWTQVITTFDFSTKEEFFYIASSENHYNVLQLLYGEKKHAH